MNGSRSIYMCGRGETAPCKIAVAHHTGCTPQCGGRRCGQTGARGDCLTTAVRAHTDDTAAGKRPSVASGGSVCAIPSLRVPVDHDVWWPVGAFTSVSSASDARAPVRTVVGGLLLLWRRLLPGYPRSDASSLHGRIFQRHLQGRQRLHGAAMARQGCPRTVGDAL